MIKDNMEQNKKVKVDTEFKTTLIEKLPEFFTKNKYNEEGELIEAAKFDSYKFKKALQGHNVEELSNGYQLDFIGKNYAKKQAGEQSMAVIVPDVEHNKKEENKISENMFFTGDNLDVLRHLQQNYADSIDIIYIDPPYNTGSDGFVYPDNFEYSDNQLKEMFSLDDEELQRLNSIKGNSSHSAWLSFMYPRLYIAKKLLKDDGAIFISIDENEYANLKVLMDEIYGEACFIENIVWNKKSSAKGVPPATMMAGIHEYIVGFQKGTGYKFLGEKRNEKSDGFKNPDNDPRGPWRESNIRSTTSDKQFTIKNPDNGKEYTNTWAFSKESLDRMIVEGRILWKKSLPKQKEFLLEMKNENKAIVSDFGLFDAQSNTVYLKELMKVEKLFPNPKPIDLIKKLISVSTDDSATILDFFAGSSTTADAILQLNAEDGGKRKYIMCTIPELTFTINGKGKEVPTEGGRNAYHAGYKSIDEISRDRILRASENIKSKDITISKGLDLGYKHYYVVPATQEILEKIEYSENMQLDLFDNMIESFSGENLGVVGSATGFDTIFHTYLAKDNYKFTVNVEEISIGTIKVPYVNKQRIYIITNDWRANHTRELVNMIGTNKYPIQTIIVYGYTIDMENLRELEIALMQLENRVSLQVRY